MPASSTRRATIDADALVKAGMLRRAQGRRAAPWQRRIEGEDAVSVYGASKSAVAAVEKAGGTVKILAPKREAAEAAA